MNKLISKNPVQRFKEGKKIEKFQGGGEFLKNVWERGFSRPTRGALNIINPIRFYKNVQKYGISNPIRDVKKAWEYGVSKPARGALNIANPFWTYRQLTLPSIPRDYSFESEQSKKQLENYFNNLKQKSAPSKRQTNVNNVWLNGYKHDEVKDVRAMQNELINLGLLKDRFGADGKWGKNTEAAYQTYLNLKNIPVYEKPETPPVAVILKQGGQLPSRNIVKRFKNRKFN